MNIVVNRAEISEFGIYKEAGAIVVGFKSPANATIHSLIVQIEEESSELGRDGLGMYVEIEVSLPLTADEQHLIRELANACDRTLRQSN